jgi:hypothetical protein
MRGLRIICIFALVALLVLGSIGTVFAKEGPPADKPGNGPKFQGVKQGFSGNVTNVVGGNVTLALSGGTVKLLAGDEFQYKVPREINKWQLGNITNVIQAVDGSLIGRRVAVQAGNDTGDWIVLKLLVLPVPGTQPMHAHRVGNVTVFNKPPSENGWIGNITIIDVHGVSHLFTVGNSSVTVYHPAGIDAGNITVGSFVTVVTTGKQKSVDLPVAKAIVLHDTNKPED